jgi:hypothetical protein
MNLFVNTPKDRFEKLFFNIHYTIYQSRVVILHKRDKPYFVTNNSSQFEIVDVKIQNFNVVIPVFFATLLMAFAILQSDIYSQIITAIVSLMLLIVSFSVKKIIFTILINENKMNYSRFDLDVKFKNVEGITFYKKA